MPEGAEARVAYCFPGSWVLVKTQSPAGVVHMLVLGKLRQEDGEFRAGLGKTK